MHSTAVQARPIIHGLSPPSQSRTSGSGFCREQDSLSLGEKPNPQNLNIGRALEEGGETVLESSYFAILFLKQVSYVK